MKTKFNGKNILLVILFVMIYLSSYAQSNLTSFRGVIRSNGEAVAGATVQLKNSNKATSSGADGAFSIDAQPNEKIIIRMIGYITAEYPLDKQNLLVELSKSAAEIDEVVVIGYGKLQKQDLTGAVGQVSLSAVKDIPVAGVDQKLTGQIAGVQIKTPTGIAGGGSQIKIRGSGSIGAGDDPLFVIDGFPISGSTGRTSNPLNTINPDDIESITVLKDASSTAIYGSRGANGVVIITTKAGKSGKPTVDLTGYTGIASVPQQGRPSLLNAQEFAQFRKEIIQDAFIARGEVATDADIPEAYRNPAQYGKGTDWYDLLFRNAAQHAINANVRGGVEDAKYAFSMGYLKQDGVLKYTGYDRFSARMNTDVSISKRLKVGLNIAPTYSHQVINDFETSFVDVVTSSLWYSPLVSSLDEQGNRTPYITSPDMYSGPHPLNKLQYGANKQKLFRGLGGSFLELSILEGLKAKYSFNVDYSVGSGFVYNPSFVGGINAPPSGYIANSGTGKSSNFNWLSEFLLNYDRRFGEHHKVDAILGYSAQKERSEGLNIAARNYPDDLIQSINAAATINGWGQDIQEWSLLSYFARVNYAYRNKLILTGTIRRDGSSRFGFENRYGTFPSGAIAYRLSEEPFFKNVSWIDELKFRGSYGLSGNFNIGNYAYVSSVGTANYVFGGVLAGGRVSTTLPNPQLTWEESQQLDFGVDFNILKNRVNLTVDFYSRNTTGMLYNSEIPLSSGYNRALINSGKIRNQGVEISLTTKNIDRAFKWNTNFNISFNRNRVMALNEKNDPIYSGRSGEGHYTHITQVGSPIGLFYGYVNQGTYATKADFDASPKHVTSVLGSIKYKDVDGNGVIEPIKDFDVIGNPTPDFVFGMTNSFSYKGVDIGILLTGSVGNDILKQANQYLNNIDGIFNVDRSVLDRWRSESNPGNGLVPTTNGARVMYRDVNSSWVEDGSFLRIQNLSLGYTFPKSMLSKWPSFQHLRIYGSIQNLATFTNYSGGNPDVVPRSNEGGHGLALVPGLDYTSYPLPRTFTIGLNMNF